MSISSEIARINSNVAATYSALEEVGADMPSEQNSGNLARTAASVKAVRYDAQTLTTAQKTQARNNIGAAPSVHTHSAEQVDFIHPAYGEYVNVPDFTDAKGSYVHGKCDTSGTVSTNNTMLFINPRKYSVGDVIRIRGLDFSQNPFGRVNLYNSDGSFKMVMNVKSKIGSAASGSLYSNVVNYTWDASTFTLTLTFTGSNATAFLNSYTYAFNAVYASGYNAESVIMTVNEEISYHTEWQGEPKRLDESLYAQSVMLVSPSGKVFKLTVSDSGALSAAAL